MSSDIPEEVVEVEEAVVEEAVAEEEAEEEVAPEDAPPPPKHRGRPVGSKHKIKVVALEPPEPEPQPVITREPTKPRKTKAPPEPVIPPPVDTSVLILNALREHQQQRAARKAAKYSAWFA